VLRRRVGELWGRAGRARRREVDRLRLALQLHVFHRVPQLVLQAADAAVRYSDGALLGMRVRLSRLLPHLVLHADAASHGHPLRQPPQAGQLFSYSSVTTTIAITEGLPGCQSKSCALSGSEPQFNLLTRLPAQNYYHPTTTNVFHFDIDQPILFRQH